ncbi:MAG: SGNH/GDSL hydrolase family protein [Planctomycetaceae bacterium]
MTIKHVLFVCLVLVACEGPVRAQPSKPTDRSGPKRWAKAIAAFEKQDRRSPPPKNGLLFVGSSSIWLWKLDKSFPHRKAINRGFGGSEIADSIDYADQLILKHKPRIVVLYAGDNDIARGKSAKRVAADFRRFVKTVHAKLPKTRILFIAIKPSIRRWKLADTMKAANTLIADQCGKNERLDYVDVFTPMLGKDGKPRAELFIIDGLHLNAAGYKLWASLLRPYLKKRP